MLIWQTLLSKVDELVSQRWQINSQVTIRSYPLAGAVALGETSQKDYPLLKGKEQMMEATIGEARGQAYTDHPGYFTGTLRQTLSLPPSDNFTRGLFIASLNALLRHLGMIEGTVHCRNAEPEDCARQAVGFIEKRWGNPRILLVGFQPRFLELFVDRFPLRVVDLDPENVGKRFGPLIVEDETRTSENILWADLLWVTGSTLVNDTIGPFLVSTKYKVFYGVTAAAASFLLGWERFCPFAH